MKARFSPRLIVAAMALSLGLAATAYAALPPGDAPNAPGAGMYQRHIMHGMKEMSRLHDDLKLDAKQDALWKEAEKAGKDTMGSMRERFRKHREEMQTLLNQPGADLRTVAKRMDEFRAEGQKLREANRDRWLSVYDALNVEQKEKARLFIKSKMERMGQMGHQGRMGDRGQRGPGRG